MGFKEGESPPSTEQVKPTTDNEPNDGDDSEHDDDAEEHGREYEQSNPIETETLTINQLDGNDTISSESSTRSCHSIPVHISNRNPGNVTHVFQGPHNLHPIKRNNKFSQTFILPKLCNINPQSVYNKKEEFLTFVEQMESDVIFMSKSWERLENILEEVMMPLEDHTIISNVHQRVGRGGEGLH